MAEVCIPVDLYNPGQVFACMGFLEAANVVLDYAEGGFDWTNEAEPRFALRADGSKNPVDAVLEFLIKAELVRLAPQGFVDPPPRSSSKNKRSKQSGHNKANYPDSDGPLHFVATFPEPHADRLALPLRFERDGHVLDVTHWCDGSSRKSFKLFAGRQRSAAIARQMLDAVRRLWKKRRPGLTSDPFGLTVPLGGSSFKFDARKSWTTIDAGYSPDEQGHDVEASPVVELLAAIGLEHARPDEFDTRQVRYGVWKGPLPPVLARPALGGARVGVPMRLFRFTLDKAGQNKVVTFSEEEAIG